MAAAAVFFLAAVAAEVFSSGGLAKKSGVAAFSSPFGDGDFLCSPLVAMTATSGR
jgi:hypothetical protein